MAEPELNTDLAPNLCFLFYTTLLCYFMTLMILCLEPVESSCEEKNIIRDPLREAHRSPNRMLTISNVLMWILSSATSSPMLYVCFQYFIYKSKLCAQTSGYIGKQ